MPVQPLVEMHVDGSVTFRGAAVQQALDLVRPGVRDGRASGIWPSPLVLAIVRALEDGAKVARSAPAPAEPASPTEPQPATATPNTATPPPPPAEPLTSAELAVFLGVHERTARRLAAGWGCARFGRDYQVARHLAEAERARRSGCPLADTVDTRLASSAP